MDGSCARAADRLASAAFSRHISARGDGMTRLLKRAKRAIHPHTLANLLSTRFLTLEPRRVHLEDATDNRTIGEHVEVVLVPLTSGAARCGALQNEFSQVKQS